MDVQFDITRSFEKDLSRLNQKDKDRVGESINKYAVGFDVDRRFSVRNIYRPHDVLMPEGLDSSLYVLRVGSQIRVILAIDSDPLFGRKIITLLRVVKQDRLNLAFKSISESLYQALHGGEADGRD